MAEGLASLITKQRSTVISKWFESAIQAYAPDTATFIRNQKDQFANPVGSHTRKAVEALFDQLMGDMDAAAISTHLDPIMRIRAVQNLTPSQATAFIFSLKKTLRDILDQQLQDAGLSRQFHELEARIDRLSLAAFDIYMACREKIYELKANESRDRTFKAFERAGLISRDP
ncbi:MAG: RsbRD N-terminal domain-containing protein [Hyphomicrobiales bacterium]